MDQKVLEVSLALLVCKVHPDKEAPLAFQEILGLMVGQDKKVKQATLDQLELEVHQVVLDPQDPVVNRDREAMMVNQVTQVTQDCLVGKVTQVLRDGLVQQGVRAALVLQAGQEYQALLGTLESKVSMVHRDIRDILEIREIQDLQEMWVYQGYQDFQVPRCEPDGICPNLFQESQACLMDNEVPLDPKDCLGKMDPMVCLGLRAHQAVQVFQVLQVIMEVLGHQVHLAHMGLQGPVDHQVWMDWMVLEVQRGLTDHVAKIFLALRDLKVFLETKDRGDTQGLMETYFLDPKARGAHRVLQVFQGHLVTPEKTVYLHQDL
ncbi:hypothetical protein INR49_012948 [Caranx melampygus]|nr:hypothetical protein INR49_012948 [Caranx melampygus]